LTHSLQARFAYQIGAVGEAGLPDAQLYGEALADAEMVHRLGYDAAWVIEHHFSDYYPQPNPLMLLSHVAAKCPGLGLGTAVMVLPWYNPIRFAEDIAMLQTLSAGELHIGMGRGTAKSEYEAFGISMETARSRFAEAWDLTRLALEGEPFTFDGEFVKIPDPIVLRPQLSNKMPNFYGAIGSPGSAEIMADLDLPPLCLSNFPDHVLKSILTRWDAKARAHGRSTAVTKPLAIKCFVGKTDKQAREEALEHLPDFFRLQVKHYETDARPWDNVPGYEQFSRMFSTLKEMCDPANLGPFLDQNLVGSPQTVAARIRHLQDIGFNYFVMTNATYGVPRSVRQSTIRLFANEVIPLVAENVRAQVPAK
jgi:alkanesulfonate monooxygenase SsuD/methylene tetrahydromethanopterin reductase-like flavin-dependent oxidoreductase (luciferase family)